MVALRANPRIVDATYLYYVLRSQSTQRKIANLHVGTMIPHFKKGDFGRLHLEIHEDLDEQRRIAEVLGVLDDLIDTNNRLIEKSKSLSTTLFNSMLEERFQCRLGEIADVNPTKIKPKPSGDLIYVDIASLGNGSIDWPAPISWAEAPGRARRGATLGSTLWSNVRPNRLGHALLLHAPDNLVVSTGISVLEPRDVGPAELHEITQTEAFVAHLVARSDGSAYPAVTADVFEDAPVERLSAADSERFEATAWPLWESVAQLEDENEQLRRTRDELLPLLMSGAVRVRPEEVGA
jgi:type I restriction enzyme S subunit